MKQFLLLLVITFSVGLLPQKGYSQNTWDFGSWNTLNLNYRLNKKTSLLLTQEARFKSNLSQLNLFYTNVGVEYRSNDYLKNALVYRHIDKYINEFGRFSYRHRIMWDMTLRYPLTEKLTVSYRHRLQVENRNIYSSRKGYLLEVYSRNKFAVKYAITEKLSADVSAEFRYQFHDPRSIESENTWHRNRFMTGISYQATDALEWGAYYLLQNEYNVSIPENLSIMGLELSVDLNKLISKSKGNADDENYLD